MAEPRVTLHRRQFFARALAALAAGAWFVWGERAAHADQPHLGEIRMIAGYYAPVGWMFCEGQLLPISEYPELYDVIGTMYGGDGQTTFALPDLRGRAPIHHGTSALGMWQLGESGVAETVTLTAQQIPAHFHQAGATFVAGTSDTPTGQVPARNAAGAPIYGNTIDSALAPGALLHTGGSQPHNNMQPYLCIHFIISLYGVYPSP